MEAFSAARKRQAFSCLHCSQAGKVCGHLLGSAAGPGLLQVIQGLRGQGETSGPALRPRKVTVTVLCPGGSSAWDHRRRWKSCGASSSWDASTPVLSGALTGLEATESAERDRDAFISVSLTRGHTHKYRHETL